jgi:ankyrin repeat protein
MTDSTSTATVSLHSPTLTVDIAARVLDTHPQRLEEKDSNGRTPLLVACFGKKWEVVTFLISRGADVTVKDKFGATALIFCAMCAQISICELLVARGADLYLKNSIGRSALSFITNPDHKQLLLSAVPADLQKAVESAPTTTPSKPQLQQLSTESASTTPSRISIIAERKQVFTHGSSSPSVATTPTAPSTPGGSTTSPYTGRTYRAPTLPPGKQVMSPTSTVSPATPSMRSVPMTPTSAVASTSVVTTNVDNKDAVVSIHNAAATIEIVSRQLEDHPERLEEKDSNARTPLLAACFAKKWDLAKFLITKGADVTVKDRVTRLV